MNDKKALLVIDMQKGSFMPDYPCFNADGVVNRINALAAIFRKLNFPVIIIQHDGTKQNEFIPNTPDWELLDELQVSPTDILISKCTNDSFYGTPLQTKLAELNTNALVITGTTTDFCIDSTVQSALSKDYNVIVVKDGHTMSDRPNLKAEKLIEHYNSVWGNLIPTKGKIAVMSFEALKKALTVAV
jgi:nicotinamidase-related amidase